MAIDLPLTQIFCDIEGRVNTHDHELENSMLLDGQLEDIVVEGPDDEDRYYLIHGYRRLMVMRRNPDCFRTVRCVIYRGISSQTERNHLRFRFTSSAKKLIGVENQFMFEEADADPELLRSLPSYKRKKLERGRKVPRELREELALKHGSQEALAVIWIDLKLDDRFRDELIHRLLTTKRITSDHAAALKKLANLHGFHRLTPSQKRFAVEATLAKGRFSNHDAELFMIQAIMQEDPEQDYADFWMLYVAHEMENLAGKIHDNIGPLISPDVRDKVIDSKEGLVAKLDAVLIEQVDAEHSENKSSETNKQNDRDTQPGPDTKNDTLVRAAKNRSGVEFVKSKKAVVPYIEHVGNTIRVVFPKT